MKEQHRDQFLRELFRRVADTPASAPSNIEEASGDHFIEDNELLERWSLDELDDAEHEEMISHLAHCPDCRGQLAMMLEMGVLELPEVAGEAVALPINRGFNRNQILAVCAAIAATIVAAVIWVGQTDPSPVALARRDLEEGRVAAAYDRISQYVSAAGDKLEATERKEAVALLENAGYQVALSRLSDREFDDVREISQTVAGADAGSGRLKNLELQARSRIATASSLSDKGVLSDYGFELDGHDPSKGAFPQKDPAEEERERALKEAIKQYPDEVSLYLNYGQLLLDCGYGIDAIKQFEKAVELAPDDVDARTGLGMAKFSLGTENAAKAALTDLRKAHDAAPDRLDTNLNLAICLVRVGQHTAARPYFRKALALCRDEVLREKIQRELD